MNNNSVSEMIELLTAHCIEFNDRVIVVEETERSKAESNWKRIQSRL